VGWLLQGTVKVGWRPAARPDMQCPCYETTPDQSGWGGQRKLSTLAAPWWLFADVLPPQSRKCMGGAELLDSFLVRPAAMFAMLGVTGSLPLGLDFGKVVADLVFYSAAIGAYELRKKWLGE
jgi:hypothetical protein